MQLVLLPEGRQRAREAGAVGAAVVRVELLEVGELGEGVRGNGAAQVVLGKVWDGERDGATVSALRRDWVEGPESRQRRLSLTDVPHFCELADLLGDVSRQFVAVETVNRDMKLM